jgi:hypothetical protein
MKTLLLTACLFLSSVAAFAEPISPRPEALLGSMITGRGLLVQTNSGGCTSKNSFVVQKEKSGLVTTLTFLRVENDLCMALFLYGVTFEYSYRELGLEAGEHFIIRNPRTFSTVR